MMPGELRQARAAELLGIGVRQVKRLVRSYRCEGGGERGVAPAGKALAGGPRCALIVSSTTRPGG